MWNNNNNNNIKPLFGTYTLHILHLAHICMVHKLVYMHYRHMQVAGGSNIRDQCLAQEHRGSTQEVKWQFASYQRTLLINLFLRGLETMTLCWVPRPGPNPLNRRDYNHCTHTRARCLYSEGVPLMCSTCLIALLVHGVRSSCW